jgi:L-arabonate dehydrase
MSRSAGTCNTMGTASTMASMAEALGMACPATPRSPPSTARRRVLAQLSGPRHRRDGQGGPETLRYPDPQAFENAIRTNAAIGGSTNAVIHLLAIAGRIGVDLTLDDWDRWAATCRPSST